MQLEIGAHLRRTVRPAYDRGLAGPRAPRCRLSFGLAIPPCHISRNTDFRLMCL